MKLHYFEEGVASPEDLQLAAAKQQGYVPTGCLLAGRVVMSEVNRGADPCAGCYCDRDVCHGRPNVKGANLDAYGPAAATKPRKATEDAGVRSYTSPRERWAQQKAQQEAADEAALDG